MALNGQKRLSANTYVQRIMGIADKRQQSQWEWVFMISEWPVVMNGWCL